LTVAQSILIIFKNYFNLFQAFSLFGFSGKNDERKNGGEVLRMKQKNTCGQTTGVHNMTAALWFLVVSKCC